MIIEKNKIFVQIGTNNGNDEFNKLVRQLTPSKVILVEPNKLCNDAIWENYLGISNVFLENIAITEEDGKRVNLYWPHALNKEGSLDGVRYDCGFSLLPMDDWGNELDVIETNGMSFNTLCEKYDITDIHYLQIDTEGYDAEIIKSINFGKINIDIIKYELWNFGEQCFKRHGDKSGLYGINGMNYISAFLLSMGYELVNEVTDMIAIKKK